MAYLLSWILWQGIACRHHNERCLSPFWMLQPRMFSRCFLTCFIPLCFESLFLPRSVPPDMKQQQVFWVNNTWCVVTDRDVIVIVSEQAKPLKPPHGWTAHLSLALARLLSRIRVMTRLLSAMWVSALLISGYSMLKCRLRKVNFALTSRTMY